MKTFLLFIFLVITLGQVYAQNPVRMGGAIILSREEEDKFIKENNIKTIQAVKPNELGMKRVNEDRIKRGRDILFKNKERKAKAGEENLTTAPEGNDLILAQALALSLPSSVDNGPLPAFPPIGDQGAIGSCVGWSASYSFSHNTGLAMGWNNKTSSKNRCSASYLYDLTKASADCGSGSTLSSPFKILTARSGCLSVDHYPNSSTSCNGFATNPQAYRDAIPYSLMSFQLIPMISNRELQSLPTEEAKLERFIHELSTMKSVLVNGYVFPMMILASNGMVNFNESYQNVVRIKSDSSGVPSSFVGELGIAYSHTDLGDLAHAITIVGYDDHAWIDGNRNGVIDFGEVGVLKFANSWGTSWGNKGFGYMTYYHVIKRGNIGGTYFANPRTIPYEPKLLAQFNFNSNQGNTLGFNIGHSSASSPVAESWLNLNNILDRDQKIPFARSLKNVTAQNAGVVIDLSELVTTEGSPERVYVSLTDSGPGASAIRDFILINPITKTFKRSSAILPLSVDETTSIIDVDHSGPSYPIENLPPVVNAGSDIALPYTASQTTLSGKASDPDGQISSVSWLQVSGPSQASFSSKSILTPTVSSLISGSYTFRLTATDNSGATASDDVIVTVYSAPAPQAPVVSAGADKIITEPEDSITLQGSASDSDGVIVSVLWTQISGPSTATLANQNALNLTASSLVLGSYVFRLKVVDSQGLASTDDVMVTVKARKGKGRR